MNRFEKHHRLAIDFGYSCFDRMVFNGYIPAFQHSACGGTIYWFLRRHRKAPPLGRAFKTSHQGTPVLSSMYQTTGIKQYVKHDVGLHGRGLRTESSSHQLRDLSIRKNLNNLNKLREVMDTANQRYLSVQQDVLASYVDRGQLEQLSRPSISATGRRVPGLHIDDPRLVATLNAILCFAYLVGKGLFHTRDLLGDVQRSLCNPHYTLSQLRYDLSKLRGKGLVLRVAGTQAYQVSSEGYRIAIF